MNEPKVADYLSCVDFLRDYYLYRKSKNRSFSYEVWGRELGYSHRSNLNLIIKGTRSLPTVLELKIEEKIFASIVEKQYFRLLCEIHRTKDLKKKSQLQAKAMALQKKREKSLGYQPGDYDVLEWLYLTVLLGFKDIDRTPEGLSKYLKEDPGQVTSALLALESRGLIRREIGKAGKVRWSSVDDYTIFKDDHGNERLANFHRQSFMKAISSQRMPKDRRRFDSLLLPLSKEQYQNMAGELGAFLDQLFYKYNSSELKGKHLYQLQIGTFPAVLGV